jgi:hypothetical protein
MREKNEGTYNYKFMDGEEISLWKGILDVEDVGEVVDNLVGMFQSETALLLQTSGCVDANWQVLAAVLALGEGFDILKVADSPGQEIGAHDRSSIELHSLQAVLDLGALLWHVTESNLIFRELELDVEGSLEIRLVETRERTACIAGFELGAVHVVKLVISWDRLGCRSDWLVLGTIETSHIVVDGSSEVDDDGCVVRHWKLASEVKGCSVLWGVICDVNSWGGRLGAIALDNHLSGVDLELMGIEGDALRCLDNLRRDLNSSIVREGFAREVDIIERQIVIHWLNIIRKYIFVLERVWFRHVESWVVKCRAESFMAGY